MRDQATIEIDCGRGVVSVNHHQDFVFSMDGSRVSRIGRAELISQCLMPQLRELMSLPEAELKKRSLVALGVTQP
jgi:hypothetical protein